MNSVFKKFWRMSQSVLSSPQYIFLVKEFQVLQEIMKTNIIHTAGHANNKIYLFLPTSWSIKYRPSDHERYFLSKDGILDEFSYRNNKLFYVGSLTKNTKTYKLVTKFLPFDIRSDQISRSAMSDSLQPHASQHTRPPCPSPTPWGHPDSRPSSQCCHLAISSSVIPFSSCPQSLPASESFPMSQLFAWDGQSTWGVHEEFQL